MNREDLKAHIETIERAYEFFLSYAALGAVDEEASKVGGQLRETLGQADTALTALETELTSFVESEGLEPAETYLAMAELTSTDAGNAGTAVRIVLAQETITSQLVDNLNASTHVRTLLTDLFLLDDVI